MDSLALSATGFYINNSSRWYYSTSLSLLDAFGSSSRSPRQKDVIYAFRDRFFVAGGCLFRFQLTRDVLRAISANVSGLGWFDGDNNLRSGRGMDLGQFLGLEDRVVVDDFVEGHWTHGFVAFVGF